MKSWLCSSAAIPHGRLDNNATGAGASSSLEAALYDVMMNASSSSSEGGVLNVTAYYSAEAGGGASSRAVTATVATATATVAAAAARGAPGALSESAAHLVIRSMQKVLIPVFCLLGVTGNLTAVGVFRSRGLKNKSCCIYLTTKCLIDSLFLAALFVVWLDRLQVRWFHHHGVCQMIVFTTYVSAFLSVWLVVMATGENYARICHPHKVHLLCTPGRAKVVLLVLGLVSIFCYHFPLWTTHSVLRAANRSECAPIPEYARFTTGLTYFDTVVTLILPLVLVVGFICGIFTALMAAHQRNKRMKKLGRQRNTKFLFLTPYGRVTAMLLAVSVTFILLHTPSHVIRIHLLVSWLTETRTSFTVAEICLQRLFELLYYSNFAMNLVTYLAFGKAFRELYVRAYCPCFRRWRRRRRTTRGSRETDENGGIDGGMGNGCSKLPTQTGLPTQMPTYSVPLYEGEDGVVTDIGVISSEMIALKASPVATS